MQDFIEYAPRFGLYDVELTLEREGETSRFHLPGTCVATPRTLKGFSLLEMLVAITVLSIVIGISTYAYSLFIRQWDGHLGRFDEAQAKYQRLEWLSAALEDTLPYVVRDDEGQLGFYFLGVMRA